MTFMTTSSDSPQGGGAFGNLDPMEKGGRGPLRHFLIGTPQRIQATIRHLHARRYVDFDQWIPLLPIGQEGLLIRPTIREVYTYVQLPPGRD